MEVSQWLAKSQRLVLALADGFTIDLQPNNTSTNSNYKNKTLLLLQL